MTAMSLFLRPSRTLKYCEHAEASLIVRASSNRRGLRRLAREGDRTLLEARKRKEERWRRASFWNQSDKK